jgi:putative Ca2+/H+ antiporter (TMEM165/GDT1 family)
MDGFWISWLIFQIIGDKTQLVALMLATRFKAGVVLAGVFVATLLVHAFSVILGDLAGKLLPHGWIMVLSGLAFIAFAGWTWRGDRLADKDQRVRRLTSRS